MNDHLPIFAICGHSNSGKTTLIERLVARLVERGLTVAVAKHAAGGVTLDKPGSDSDRLFAAGAEVLLASTDQTLARTRRRDDDPWDTALATWARRCDLLLLEGHKHTDVPKAWLLAEGETAPPAGLTHVVAVLGPGDDRLETTLPILETLVAARWCETPLYGCVLIGGASTRMGRPKHLLRAKDGTWLARTVDLLSGATRRVVIAGSGEMPGDVGEPIRLPDAPDAAGPLAGILAAMRWAPEASWLVAACDLPALSAGALEWLSSTRRPGVWACLPKLPGSDRVEPLLAHYDFRCRTVLEQLAARGELRPRKVAGHPKAITPVVPAHLAVAWQNANAPDDAGVGEDEA